MFVVTETRVCSRCHEELPIGHFRLRNKGEPDRLPDCRKCHARSEKRNRAVRRRRHLRAGLQMMTTAASDEELRRLVKALLVRCGGAEKLAKDLCELLERIEKHSQRVPAKWHWDVHLALYLIMRSAS